MPSRRHPNGIFTWRNTFLATVMSILLVGVVTLIYFLSVARSQGGLPHPQHGGLFRPNRTISFPFGHNHKWVNASRDGRCPAHFFRCKGSPRCVELDRRCDGRVDCPSAEDEMECVCAFRMPVAKFCDKYPDCFDESDESFCSYCPLGSFNCGNGQCVAKSKVCDTEIDCDNFMDENFCFRLSNSPLVPLEEFEHAPPTAYKSGFLLRNQKGAWFPVCANPHDFLQSSLASFACVSITANPMVSSTHSFRRFGRPQGSRDFLYHYQGRFVKWRGCLTNGGIFVSCSDGRCGFNPQQLVPKRPRGRIVGGELSEPGAWPWHAAVYKNGSYSCGATLINNRWLISAAHCFLNHKHNYYEVQLGMLRRRSFTPHQKTHPLDRVIPHHKFNIVTLEYDIALLRTSHPVEFDFWIRPICLPPRVSRKTWGTLCTAIGWGDTGETEDDSDDLLEVHVPVTKACKRNSDRWMCAGLVEGGRDACQGDSGGPLMCLKEDGFSWYIAGVISGGTGCARPKTPGMYTRVVYYLDWIAKVVASRGRGEITPLKACPGWKCPVLGGGNCLRKERVCDAHVDCYDAQDEANCTTWT